MAGYSSGGFRRQAVRKCLFALAVYLVYCGLSLLGRISNPWFAPVVLFGIFFPLVWGRLARNSAEMGFSGRNLPAAVWWGIAAGVITGLIGRAMITDPATPHDIGRQLLIGIPLWLLVAAPFQEFFFRGWLQTRLAQAVGAPLGICIATFCFTLWHYIAPLVGQTAVPLETASGFLSTLVAGLIYAYAFHRTGNIAAPWIAHVTTGVIFILFGVMDFSEII
jgi:membrane protease YdiL (CAAX protease family)